MLIVSIVLCLFVASSVGCVRVRAGLQRVRACVFVRACSCVRVRVGSRGHCAQSVASYGAEAASLGHLVLARRARSAGQGASVPKVFVASYGAEAALLGHLVLARRARSACQGASVPKLFVASYGAETASLGHLVLARRAHARVCLQAGFAGSRARPGRAVVCRAKLRKPSAGTKR